MTSARAPWVWAALIAVVWLVLVLCTHWEPIVRDSWGHVSWHRDPGLTAEHLWQFLRDGYLGSNPRLGQVVSLLQFTPGPWHVVLTPLLELALFYLLSTLALGRWPSLRRIDDALVAATIVAVIAVCAPTLGPMLFYRPFTGNYLFGHVLGLLWLVPYRLHATAPRRWPWWLALPMLVLGAAEGMCNEHTGPALLALGVVATVAFVRRGERPAPWMIAGVIGLAAGGLALYYAPGQAFRYDGLAAQQSLVGRIVARGAYGNLKLFINFGRYLLPALAWLALAVIARWPTAASDKVAPAPRDRVRDVCAIAGVAGALAIVVTLLASPKQGERLYFMSIALVAAAIAATLVPRLVTRATRTAGAVLAAGAIAWFAVRCVTIYAVVGHESAARYDAIVSARPGTTVYVWRFTQAKSRWFLGEDLEVASHRHDIAANFGLAALELEPDSDHPAAPPSASAVPADD